MSRRFRAYGVLLAGMMAATPASPVYAADMADVKALYASAAYEEALATLGTLDPDSNAGLVEQYRALCLLALGRTADAEAALEALVTQHPRFTVQENEVSPRLVTLYRTVRTRVLPAIIRDEYAAAKTSFDQGDFQKAADHFEYVLEVIGEAGADPSLSDLRLLSEGFARLAAANVRPANLTAAKGSAPGPVEATLPSAGAPTAGIPPAGVAPGSVPPSNIPAASVASANAGATRSEAPPAARPEETPAGTTPAEPGYAWKGIWAPPTAATAGSIFDASHADVVPPEEVSRYMPPWTPRTPLTAATTFRGTIQIVIDEKGEVVTATLAKPLTPEYDGRLLTAARNWKYRPAMKDGRPVKYTSHIDIVLRP